MSIFFYFKESPIVRRHVRHPRRITSFGASLGDTLAHEDNPPLEQWERSSITPIPLRLSHVTPQSIPASPVARVRPRLRIDSIPEEQEVIANAEEMNNVAAAEKDDNVAAESDESETAAKRIDNDVDVPADISNDVHIDIPANVIADVPNDVFIDNIDTAADAAAANNDTATNNDATPDNNAAAAANNNATSADVDDYDSTAAANNNRNAEDTR